MKFHKLFLPAAALMLAATTASCSNDDNNGGNNGSNVLTFNFASNEGMTAYPAAQPDSAGNAVWSLDAGAEMVFKFDMLDASNTSLVTTFIPYAEGKSVRLDLQGVVFGAPDAQTGFRSISLPRVTGYGQVGETVEVDNFLFSTIVVMTAQGRIALLSWNLYGEVDGRPFRMVKASQTGYYGTTVLQYGGNTSTTHTDNTQVGISFDYKSRTAAIVALYPTFSNQMANSAVYFPSLPFTVDASGIKIDAPQFSVTTAPKPTTDGQPTTTPVAGESGTDLMATVPFQGDVILTFTYLNGANPVEVRFDGGYLPRFNQ